MSAAELVRQGDNQRDNQANGDMSPFIFPVATTRTKFGQTSSGQAPASTSRVAARRESVTPPVSVTTPNASRR